MTPAKTKPAKKSRRLNPKVSWPSYLALLDALTDQICVLDQSGTILAVNQAWRDFAAANPPVTGNVREGANYFAICKAAIGPDAPIARQTLQGLLAVVRGELPEFTLEYPCHSPETQRWFELRAVRVGPLRSVRLLVAHRNVTQHKQAMLALHATEERYRTVVEDQTEVICRFRADGTFLFVNDVYCRFFGKSASELLGGKWQPVAHAEDISRIEAELRTLSPEKPVVVVENRIFSGTGELRWMQFVNRGFFDAQGRLQEVQSIGRDITERKDAELKLRAESQRLFEVLDTLPVMVCLLTPDHQVVFANRGFRDRFGEARGRPCYEYCFGKATPCEFCEAHVVLKTGQPHRWEVPLPDGGLLEVYDLPFTGTDGSPMILQMDIDISERRRAEEALRESEARCHSLVASSLDAVMLTGPDGRILSANEAACRMFGRTKAELIRVGRAGVVDVSDPRLAPALEARARTGRFYGELTLVRADGSKFPVEVSSVIFHGSNGEPFTSMVIRDISERKRLEAEREAMLAHLATVEEQERCRLSRELHDQTAQRIVALAVELKTLERNLDAGRLQRERVGALRKAVDELQQQVREIAWDLRAGELLEGNLESALQEFVEEWSERTRVAVDCECRGGSKIPLPRQVATPLYRIVKEALTNVEKHARASHVSVMLERDAGLIRLTVEDNGRGFDVDSTQSGGDATQRLGLLGMKERVVLTGGTFLIESSPKSGTTILVRIPIPTELKPT